MSRVGLRDNDPIESLAPRAFRSCPDSWSGALGRNFIAESVESGRSTAAFGPRLFGAFHQTRGLHHTAKILLVKEPAAQGFHCLLELGEGKKFGEQLEHQRTVGQFSSYSGQSRGGDSPVVGPQGAAQILAFSGFFHQTGFVEKLVSLQNPLRVPGRTFQPEEHPTPPLTIGLPGCPVCQALHHLSYGIRPGLSRVFPGEKLIKRDDPLARQLLHQTEIGDGEGAVLTRSDARPHLIAEGVKLLQVADFLLYQLLQEATDTELEGGVLKGQGTTGKLARFGILEVQPGSALPDGNERGGEFDDELGQESVLSFSTMTVRFSVSRWIMTRYSTVSPEGGTSNWTGTSGGALFPLSGTL